jgi:FixJ family two-component response regulator
VSVSSAGGCARDLDEQPVLVVDDHQLVGSSLVLALASRGLHAQECPVTATGDILRAAEERRSGLVLLDLNLGVGVSGEPSTNWSSSPACGLAAGPSL